MSTGRGRGYSGRHHARDPRPGDAELCEDLIAARTLAELSPRTTDPKIELNKQDILDKIKPKEMNLEHDKMRKVDKPLIDLKLEVKYHVSGDDELAIKELLNIDEQYAPLLLLLEQFSPGEDGIQFNRKLRQFEATITNLCPDETRLHQAFATFRAAALLSSLTARKLAAVGASFTRQQRQQLLRAALLNVAMQGTFCKLDILERANPSFLINAANLMGDYFAEARLCNGNKVHILASPLLQYMRALLASDDIRAHRSLATQLMQNGRELLSILSQELDDLSISIRLRLLTPPPVSIIWLLLSADLCLNKFLPLPNTLQQFYAAHLELTTDDSFSEISYGSWKKSPDKEDYSDTDLAEKVSQNVSQISLNHDEDPKPKLRPILGAGAGLLRQEQLNVSQDAFDTWTSKSSLSKRYDLNSWRQPEDDQKEEPEPVFNPTVLPPNVPQSFPVTVPDYPPPNVRFNNYPTETFPNYLQQGDGTYIKENQFSNANFTSQGDFVPPLQTERPQTGDSFTSETKEFPPQFQNDRPPKYTPEVNTEYVPQFTANDIPIQERITNEVQKTSSRRPVENWRKDKSEPKDDPNRNKPKNWTRQRSTDNIHTDDDKELSQQDDKLKSRSSRDVRPANRTNRRNSGENPENDNANPAKAASRRHVSDVPRNHKYWDHDDRCDKDYNS